eukprot:6212532-Pleurochrysis_carterae.AAC.2
MAPFESHGARRLEDGIHLKRHGAHADEHAHVRAQPQTPSSGMHGAPKAAQSRCLHAARRVLRFDGAKRNQVSWSAVSAQNIKYPLACRLATHFKSWHRMTAKAVTVSFDTAVRRAFAGQQQCGKPTLNALPTGWDLDREANV